MFQKPSKTLYYMEIMVCKISPWGGAKTFLVIGLLVDQFSNYLTIIIDYENCA